MAFIKVDHVTKEYHLGQPTSFKGGLQHILFGLTGKSLSKKPPFKALDDISFEVKQGEVLGIIGMNGAGKSTLLKLLSKIIEPTRGNVLARGKVAPLIEVGAGLNPELTGKENIYLNAAIMGLSYSQIKKKFDGIVTFAELEEFIDTPVKRYSSGMAVRLGFSVATSVDADILIVDEVLAVGDLAFQRKCFDRMEDMIRRQGKTVILVSHNMRQVARLCSRAILLDKGRILADEEPAKICDLFYSITDEKIGEARNKHTGILYKDIRGRNEIEILNICIFDENGKRTEKVKYGKNISVVLRIKCPKDLNKPTFGIGFHTADFLYLTTHCSESQLNIQKMDSGEHMIKCDIRGCPLLPGVYSLRAGITAGDVVRTVFYQENLLDFQVITAEEKPVPLEIREGFFALDATWRAD